MGQREEGSPKNSFKEFRRRLPSVEHSMSKRLISPLSNGLTVTESKAFSTLSINISVHFIGYVSKLSP